MTRRVRHGDLVVDLLAYVAGREPALNIGRYGKATATVAIRQGLIRRVPAGRGVFAYVLTDAGRDLLTRAGR